MAATKQLLVWLLAVIPLALLLDGAAGLRMAIMRTECLTEEVPNEGDIVTGSFVVLDHQSAWAEQHPGMDLGVRALLILANPDKLELSIDGSIGTARLAILVNWATVLMKGTTSQRVHSRLLQS